MKMWVRSWAWRGRLIAGFAAGLLALTPLGAWAEPPAGDIRDFPGDVRPEGQGFCFPRDLVLGGIVVPGGGRCYNFYLLRTGNQVFLGFGPPGQPLVPPGQIVRLNTPAGATARSGLLNVIRLPMTATGLPADTIQFVNVRVGTLGGLVIVAVPGPGERPVEVGFEQR